MEGEQEKKEERGYFFKNDRDSKERVKIKAKVNKSLHLFFGFWFHIINFQQPAVYFALY